MEMADEVKRSIWCGNLGVKVTQNLLYELFLQAGPIEKITLPKDQQGFNRGFAFILYTHASSVNYAIDLFNNISLYSRKIVVKRPNNCPEEPLMTNQTNETFNQSSFPQDTGLNVSALTPLNQPLIMPGANPFGVFNMCGPMNPFATTAYPSQMDNRFDQPNSYQSGFNSNWNNFSQNDNGRCSDGKNNKGYNRGSERNFDKSNDRNFNWNNERNFNRGNERGRDGGFERRDDRNWEQFDRDRNFDRQNRNNWKNDGNCFNNRNFDRNGPWSQGRNSNEGTNNRNFDYQSRKRDHSSSSHSSNKRSRN